MRRSVFRVSTDVTRTVLRILSKSTGAGVASGLIPTRRPRPRHPPAPHRLSQAARGLSRCACSRRRPCRWPHRPPSSCTVSLRSSPPGGAPSSFTPPSAAARPSERATRLGQAPSRAQACRCCSRSARTFRCCLRWLITALNTAYASAAHPPKSSTTRGMVRPVARPPLPLLPLLPLLPPLPPLSLLPPLLPPLLSVPRLLVAGAAYASGVFMAAAAEGSMSDSSD